MRISRSSTQLSFPVGIPFDVVILLLPLCIWLCSFASRKRLLKVGNDVVNMLCSHGYPNEVFRDTAVRLFLIAQLFVRCAPGVDCQGLRVADTVTR